MYLRETKRRNADGSDVSYLALAHNQRDPKTGVPRAQIVHRFGRADRVDREALRRLVKSISRFLDPGDAVAATVSGEVSVVDSRAMAAAGWPTGSGSGSGSAKRSCRPSAVDGWTPKRWSARSSRWSPTGCRSSR
jgi:hypothetical protein